jgi:hypothetical protein
MDQLSFNMDSMIFQQPQSQYMPYNMYPQQPQQQHHGK